MITRIFAVALATKLTIDIVQTKRGPFAIFERFRAIEHVEIQAAVACATCLGVYIAAALTIQRKFVEFAVAALASLELALMINDLIGAITDAIDRS